MPSRRTVAIHSLRLALCLAACAAPPTAQSRLSSAPAFLMPEQAFALRVTGRGADEVEAVFEIAPGYYLYRDKLHFAAEPAVLGAVAVPAGQTKFDETFQKDLEVHRGSLRVLLSLAGGGAGPIALTVAYQGCADQGLCYAPQRWQGVLRRQDGLLRVGSPVAADPTPPPVSSAAWTAVATGLVMALGLIAAIAICRKKKRALRR